MTVLHTSEHPHAQEARDLSRPPVSPRGGDLNNRTGADLPAVARPAPAPIIRLRLTSGHVVKFDNYIDLWDYVEERMFARGEL